MREIGHSLLVAFPFLSRSDDSYKRFQSSDPSRSRLIITSHEIQTFVFFSVDDGEATVFLKKWRSLRIFCQLLFRLSASSVEYIYRYELHHKTYCLSFIILFLFSPVFQPSRASLISMTSICCLALHQNGLRLGSYRSRIFCVSTQ